MGVGYPKKALGYERFCRFDERLSKLIRGQLDVCRWLCPGPSAIMTRKGEAHHVRMAELIRSAAADC